MTGKRFAFITGVVCLVMLLLFEGLARLLAVGGGDVGAVIPDAQLGWRLAPDHIGEMAGVEVAIGPHGVRVPGPKVPASARAQAGQVVWLMGDSFSFGWGLSYADTVAAQLEDSFT